MEINTNMENNNEEENHLGEERQDIYWERQNTLMMRRGERTLTSLETWTRWHLKQQESAIPETEPERIMFVCIK